MTTAGASTQNSLLRLSWSSWWTSQKRWRTLRSRAQNPEGPTSALTSLAATTPVSSNTPWSIGPTAYPERICSRSGLLAGRLENACTADDDARAHCESRDLPVSARWRGAVHLSALSGPLPRGLGRLRRHQLH